MSRSSWVIFSIIVVGFFSLAILNGGSEPVGAAEIWNENMSKGDSEAPNRFIQYTDIVCPYCANFHNAVKDSDFNKDYIDSGKVHMEIRVVPMLREMNVNSDRSAESSYCAAGQGKFYEYYSEIVGRLTDDYFSKGIGVSHTSPKIPLLEDSYYLEAAKAASLDLENMENCLESGEYREEIEGALAKAIERLPYGAGVPFFVINDVSGSGFDGDYSAVEQLMRSGGVN